MAENTITNTSCETQHDTQAVKHPFSEKTGPEDIATREGHHLLRTTDGAWRHESDPETISVPKALAPYITVGEMGIRLKPREEGELAVAMLVMLEKVYPSWHTMFPAGLEKALGSRFRETRRLFFLVKGMPDDAELSIRDSRGKGTVFFSGWGYSISNGEWIGEPPEELPIVPYADITKLVGYKSEKTANDTPVGPTHSATKANQSSEKDTENVTATATGEVVTSSEPPAVVERIVPRTAAETSSKAEVAVVKAAPYLQSTSVVGANKTEQYREYLKTSFAKMHRHGRFKIGPVNENGKRSKIPVDVNGIRCDVKLFNETAEKVVKTLKEDEILGFSVVGGIIEGEGEAATRVVALDYDDVVPPFENGYCERSVSGSGAHTIIRIPNTGSTRETFESAKKGKEEIDYTYNGCNGHLEMFHRVQAVALTGGGKVYGSEAFTAETRQAEDISAVLRQMNKAKNGIKEKAPVAERAGKATTTTSQKTGGFCPVGLTEEQFAELNRYHSPDEYLSPAEYERKGNGRWLYYGSKSGCPGVAILPNGKLWSFHRDDPLNEHPHDTWDMLMRECGGDHALALKAALQLLGMPTSLEEVRATAGPSDAAPAHNEQNVPAEKMYKQPPAPKTKTLEEIADDVSQMNGVWLKITIKKAKNPDAEDVIEATIDLPAWYQVWHDKTYLAQDGKSKTGVYWFNGGIWQHMPFEKDFKVAMTRALLPYPNVKTPSGWDDIGKIVALRKGMMSFNENAAEHIFCTDGTRIMVTPDGIQIDKGDPDTEVWTSGIGVSGPEIFDDLTKVEYPDLLNRFPNFKTMMEACDSDTDKNSVRTHSKMMATIAGSVFYSFFAPSFGFPPLDAIFWLYDANVSRTGKSTHARMLTRAFGKLATQSNPADLMSSQGRTGNLLGCVMVWADEASDCKIADTGLFKALPSGTASIKKLYHDPTDQQKPVIIVATANGAPDLVAYKASEALKRRLIPYEYTIQHETSSGTGCPESEALAAIINLGVGQCYRIMRAVSAGESGRSAWLYRPVEDEVEKMFERVYWPPMLGEMLEKKPFNDIPIPTLWRSLLYRLVREGRCEEIPLEKIKQGDVKGYNLPSQLRSETAFRNTLKNRRLSIKTENGSGYLRTEEWVCAVHDCGSKKTPKERFVLRGVDFRNSDDKIEPEEPQTAISDLSVNPA